jgi:hypothetical protein
MKHGRKMENLSQCFIFIPDQRRISAHFRSLSLCHQSPFHSPFASKRPTAHSPIAKSNARQIFAAQQTTTSQHWRLHLLQQMMTMMKMTTMMMLTVMMARQRTNLRACERARRRGD